MRTLALSLHGEDKAASEPTRLLALLLLFVMACTIGTVLSRLPVPIYDDVAEAWAWGRDLQLGYYKHPPLTGWIAGLWSRIFPSWAVSAYLLGATNAALGLVGVWLVAGQFLGDRCRLAATAVLILSPFWSMMATKFNANTVLLSVWPWTIYFFIRSIERRTLGDAVAFGLMCAVAMLAKYVSILLLVSCFAASLLHPGRRAYYRSAVPYVAVVVFVVAMLPHAWWSWKHGFPTVAYALAKTEQDVAVKQWKAVKSIFTTLITILPMLIGVRIVLGRRAWSAISPRVLVERARGREWLIVLAFGPLLLTAALGLTGIVKVAQNFFTPMTAIMPTAILALSPSAVESHRLTRSLRSVGGLLVAWIALSPAIALALMGGLDEYKHAASKEAVEVAAGLWKQHVPSPVRLVAGTERYSLALTFYVEDHPSEFTHFSFVEAPWVTPERIRAEGLLVICLQLDTKCNASVERWRTPQSIQVSRTVQSMMFGWRGPDREFRITVIPPATVPPAPPG